MSLAHGYVLLSLCGMDIENTGGVLPEATGAMQIPSLSAASWAMVLQTHPTLLGAAGPLRGFGSAKHAPSYSWGAVDRGQLLGFFQPR